MSGGFEICGKEIEEGEIKRVHLDVARLPTGMEIFIPIYIFRGADNGPTLLLLAGMHGDEINGVESIRRMIAENLIRPDRGTVIAIPLFNVFGFINFARQVSNGKDVNRSFPGMKAGSLASRLAYQFMKEVFPKVDYGIDFHTGGESICNYSQVRCLIKHEESMNLAKAFATYFILNSSLRPKSLRAMAMKKNVPIIVYEAGESLRLNRPPVTHAINGTLRVMKYLGMIDREAPEPEKSIILRDGTWVRAKRSGMFRCWVRNGALVKNNDLLGTISDPYGEYELHLYSPLDAYVVGINRHPVVTQGDALIHLGTI